jgi:hypothetical protein
MNNLKFFYLIIILTYLALKTTLIDAETLVFNIYAKIFLVVNIVGIIVEFCSSRGYLVISGIRHVALRLVICLDIFFLIVLELVESIWSLDLMLLFSISQILMLATIALCITLIPDESTDSKKESASDYKKHGSVR